MGWVGGWVGGRRTYHEVVVGVDGGQEGVEVGAFHDGGDFGHGQSVVSRWVERGGSR